MLFNYILSIVKGLWHKSGKRVIISAKATVGGSGEQEN